MRPFYKCLLGIALLSCLSTPGIGAEKTPVVILSQEVPFAENSGVTPEVREECKLPTRLPKFIQSFAKKHIKVEITSDAIQEVEGKVLKMEFTQVLGRGGGAWSGSKSVTVKGELVENGEVVGNFTASRYSGGGVWGGFKGTCSILGRCIKAIGKDIAAWLRSPTMDARLGDS